MNNLRDENEMTVSKEYVKWNDLEEYIDYLASQVNFDNFTGVYGLPRGGATIAVIISNRYNLPFLGAPQVGCLCVDEICDSGDTALAWRQKGYTIATMYYNKKSRLEPDIWWKEKTDKWIIFPWEEDTRNK